MAADLISTLIGMVIFIILIASCCASDSGSSNRPKTKPKPRTTQPRTTYRERDYSYSECPSCGAPYYDGYCEECGYPDINQGWLGENY